MESSATTGGATLPRYSTRDSTVATHRATLATSVPAWQEGSATSDGATLLLGGRYHIGLNFEMVSSEGQSVLKFKQKVKIVTFATAIGSTGC